MVQSDAVALRARCVGSEREEAEVVVVVAARGPEEGGPAGHLVLDGEAEHLAVEGDGTFDITDEQDSVVEPAYGHRAPSLLVLPHAQSILPS